MRVESSVSPGCRRVDTSAQILVVASDLVTRVILAQSLEALGYRVAAARTPQEIRHLLTFQRYNLVLFDLCFPERSACLRLIARHVGTYARVLVALVRLNQPADRELARRLGAGDCLGRPLSTGELAPLIGRMLSGAATGAGPRLSLAPLVRGPFQLTPSSRRLIARGTAHDLSPCEARLCAAFLLSPGAVMDRQTLTRAACGRDWSYDDRTIDVLVARLRRRIEDTPRKPQWLRTVHGVGYTFGFPLPEPDAPDTTDALTGRPQYARKRSQDHLVPRN